MSIKNRLIFLISLFPTLAFGGVCETIYDGDKAIEIIRDTPSNYSLTLKSNNLPIGDISHVQLEAFYNAKEKIQQNVGIYPKFVVCGDTEPNAFAYEQKDGTVVGVSLGMLKLIDGDEDMAAAVIGHEIAHHTQNHRLKTQQNEVVTNILSAIIGIYIESQVQQRYRVSGVGLDVAVIGSALTLSKFSRDQEREADEVGFKYMIDAGYNPEASIRLADLMQRKGLGSSGLFYDTHPGWDERAARFRIFIANSSKAQQIVAANKTNKPVLAKLDTKPANGDQSQVLNPVNVFSESDKSLNEAVNAYSKNKMQEAVRLFKVSANQGNAIAQFTLGNMYINGTVVEKSDSEAFKFFKLSADQGNKIGINNLGVMYEKGYSVPKDLNEAIKLYRLAADKGYAQAQVNLGAMYLKGLTVPKDTNEALRLFKLSANQNYPSGLSSLGFMYQTGAGINKDPKEAARLYRLAADKGDPFAQAALGGMYIGGVEIDKNYSEGLRLVKLSVDQKIPLGYTTLAYMYESGTAVTKDLNQAFKYYSLAADKDDSLGQYNLGKMYETGRGVPQKNIKEALRLYELAANKGFANAQEALGGLYTKGDGVAINYPEAFRLFKLSADQGNVISMNNLGVMYQQGFATNKDINEAVKYYRSSSDKGYSQAQINLANLYLTGNGVEKNEEEGIRLLKLAAAQGNPVAINYLKQKGIK